MSERGETLAVDAAPVMGTAVRGGMGEEAGGWWRRLRRTHWGEAWSQGNFPGLSDLPVAVRVKLLLLVTLIGAAVFGLVSAHGERQISQAIEEETAYRRMADLASDLRAEALAMQSLQQEFRLTRDPQLIGRHRQAAQAVSAHLEDLARMPVAAPAGDTLISLRQGLVTVNGDFEQVVRTEQQLGLGEGDGLRGALMTSVRGMEDELKVWTSLDGLWNKALGMRQAEKDFMLYGGSEHLGKFRKFSMEFDLKIDTSGVPPATADKFRSLLAAYTHDMAAFAEASTALTGQLAVLHDHMDALQPAVARLFTYGRDGAARATETQNGRRAAVTRETAMVGGLVLVVFLLLSVVLSRSIVAPIRLIENTMRRLVGGEHGVAVPGTVRRDEIGDMARAVAVFKENTLAMVQLQQEHETLMMSAEAQRRAAMADLATQFEGTVKTVVESVHSGAEAISETARRMALRAQAQGVEESRSLSVAEAAVKAQDSVEAARAAAEELSASIREVASLVDESAAVAGTGAGELEDVDRQVDELSDAAGQIDTVVALINQIAHQTNMLALNATIEAARAGEAGRGFAVVANEVKHLADQTAQATSRIAAQVAAIQGAASDTARTIGAIGGTLRRMMEITTAVNTAMLRQAAATDRIDHCVQAVSEDSRIVIDGVIGVTQSAAAYCGSAIRVLWAATDLTRPVHVLRTEVDAFLSRVRS